MAQHASAEKQAKQSIKKNLANRSYMSKVKTAIKKFLQAAQEGKTADLQALFQGAQSSLMKASTKGIIHKNNASRHIGRLSKVFAKAQKKSA